MHTFDRSTALRGMTLMLVVISILAACGSVAPQPSPTPEGPTPTITVPFELPTTLSLLAKFGEEELALVDEQIARFEAANPDVLVEIKELRASSGERHQVVSQYLSGGGGGVDVVLIDDVWLAEFVQEGWLAPLDDYLAESGLDTGGFFPAALQASTLDGQLYALPRLVDAGLLYAQQETGSAPLPATWSGVQDLALEAKRAAGLPSGYVWQGAATDSLTCNALEYVWASGGQVFDAQGQVVFDSPQTRAALQQMVSFIDSGASPEEVAAFTEGESLSAFADEQAALMRNWPYAWDILAGDVEVAPLPAACLLGQNMALAASSRTPEKAFRLMQFLAGPEQQIEVATRLGRPPALATVYDDAHLLATRPLFVTLKTANASARSRPQTPAYLQVSEAIYTEVNRMLLGEQTVDETAENVQRRIAELASSE